MKNAKRNRLVADDAMKGMRIREKPIGIEGLLVKDDLETEGVLKLYEHTGGSPYLSMEPSQMDNAALVAEIAIVKSGEAEVAVDRIFFEYGHENLEQVMAEQVGHFAEFYGYGVKFLNLKKDAKREQAPKAGQCFS